MGMRAIVLGVGLMALAGAGLVAQTKGAAKPAAPAGGPAEKLPPGVSADWTRVDWQIVTKKLDADVFKNFEPGEVMEAVEWYIGSQWRDQGGGLYGSLPDEKGKRLDCKEWKKEVLRKLLTPEPDPKGYNRLRDVVRDYYSEVSATRGNLDIVDPCRQ